MTKSIRQARDVLKLFFARHNFSWDNRPPRWWHSLEAWLKWQTAVWFAGYRNRRGCWVTWALWAMDAQESWLAPWNDPARFESDPVCKGDALRSHCGMCWCGHIQCKGETK